MKFDKIIFKQQLIEILEAMKKISVGISLKISHIY